MRSLEERLLDRLATRRLKIRKYLSPVYLPYYDAMCSLLSYNWQPISGLRSFEEQHNLYLIGRGMPGDIVTNADAGMSYHNYGMATDWNYFWQGRYTPLSKEDPRWAEYTGVLTKVGLRFIEWDKPHNELDTLVKPRELLAQYQIGGMDAVNKLVEKELTHGQSGKNI